MTYSNHTSASISPIIEALSELAEGASLLIEDMPSNINSIRQALYSHFYQNSLKGIYKVKRLNKEQLLVIRNKNYAPKITVLKDNIGELFCRDYLLDLDDEESVLKTIQSSELSPEEQINALNNWRRINNV